MVAWWCVGEYERQYEKTKRATYLRRAWRMTRECEREDARGQVESGREWVIRDKAKGAQGAMCAAVPVHGTYPSS